MEGTTQNMDVDMEHDEEEAYFVEFDKVNFEENNTKEIRGVKSFDENVCLILDSGADVSVLPVECATIGRALNKQSVLRDAQGNRMPGGGCGDFGG